MTIQEDVRRALAEDLGSGDVTASLLPEAQQIEAEIVSREPMLVCGQAWVEEVFTTLDPDIHCQWHVEEGAWLPQAASLCHLQGPARAILSGERAALNFLQTLSGTATQTYAYVQALSDYDTQLLDTRKTIPGLRQAQKYAVACAGAKNHRMGLYDAFLIKENHIAACGSISKAITAARCNLPDIFLEIEVQNLDEFQEALSGEPDRILLDNFDLATMTAAVNLNVPRVCDLEVSGGIDLSTLTAVAQTGVDYISVGALTKSVRAIDLSLLVVSQ
ncbi:MAG: carboxylating nicotinate-nucleotide diphosphorylase [Gammaproteobacteria bacterium]|nr:carboxylating nicotinate-nucleotide diphosphorylase [Gammaproteobacteria bacterium]